MPLQKRYIDSLSSGGDGTTPALSGPNAAYASWGDWNTAEATDLTADGDIHRVYVAAGTYLEAIEITAPWVTDAQHYIQIRAKEGDEHLGVIGAGPILQNTANFTPALRLREKCIVEDITLRSSATGNAGRCLFLNVGADNSEFKRCIIGDDTSATEENIFDDADNIVFEACVIYGSLNAQGLVIDDFIDARVKNCTIVKNATVGLGIGPNGGTITDVYNTVAYGNGTLDFTSTRIQGDWNASGDASAPGGNSTTGITSAAFTDYDGNDFSLADGSALIDAGTEQNRAELSIQRTAWFGNDIGAYAKIPAQTETAVDKGRFFPGLGIQAESAQTYGVFRPGFGIFSQENVGAPPSDDVIVTLGQAAQTGIDATDPTVDFSLDAIVNLGQAAQTGVDATVPQIEFRLDQIVNLANAATTGLDATVPTVESPDPTESTTVFLGQAARSGLDATVPTVEFKLDQIVNLANAATSGIDATAPIVDAGANAIVTLGNAAQAGTEATVPIVITELTHFVNLGQAAQTGIDATAPQVEGEPFLPPSITVPTDDQTLLYNRTGVIPAPLFDPGTGGNINWSLLVDEFSAQPGVTNFTINATTGDINYTIAQLTSDADVQALNTKGPYNITRRVTTTVGNDDESWQIGVNVGSYTLEFTPGSKLVTWETATPLARGLQTDKDLSAPVTQTYTVT